MAFGKKKAKPTTKANSGGGLVTAEEFKKKLGKLTGKWGSAQKEAAEMSGGGGLSDGRHIARLTKYEVKKSPKGNLGLYTTWTAIRGDSKGDSQTRYDGLEREEGLAYLAKYFNQLRLEIPELTLEVIKEQFDALLEAGCCAKIRVVTKDGSEYSNLYLDKLIDDPGDDEDETPAEESAEESSEEAAEEEDGSPEVDMVVTVMHGGKEKEGTITEVDEKKQTAKVKLPGIKEPVSFKWDAMTPVTDEEEEAGEDSEADGEATVSIGDKVLVDHDGKEKEGTVESIDEKNETMMVKLPKLAKAIKFKFENVAPLVDE
jgi:hypothetical protein